MMVRLWLTWYLTGNHLDNHWLPVHCYQASLLTTRYVRRYFLFQQFLWSPTNIDTATRARPLLWALARLAQLLTPLHLCRLSTRQLLSRQSPAKLLCRLCIPLPRSRLSTPRPQLPLFLCQSNQFPLVAPSSMCLLQQSPPAHPSMSTRLFQLCPLLSHPQLAPVYQALVPQPAANRPNLLALPTRHSLPRVLVWPPFWGLLLTCCKRFATRSLLFMDNPFLGLGYGVLYIV